jgi:hypothetical protein
MRVGLLFAASCAQLWFIQHARARSSTTALVSAKGDPFMTHYRALVVLEGMLSAANFAREFMYHVVGLRMLGSWGTASPNVVAVCALLFYLKVLLIANRIDVTQVRVDELP